MAFVFQSKRKTLTDENSNTQVGPGSYMGPKAYKVSNSYAPFNSTSEKDSIKKEKPVEVKKNSSLNNSLEFSNKEKVLAHFIDENLKVVEAPKMSSVFKSESKRFIKNQLEDVPGPGSYEIKNSSSKPRYRVRPEDQRNNIIFDVFDNYQKVPSIPGRLQEMGYNDEDAGTLELNPITMNHTGNVKDSAGPGEYDIKGAFEAKKGPSFGPKHNVLNKKKQVKKNKKVIGPGSYNPKKEYVPLYKYKTSSAFASGSKRSFGSVPGEQARSFLMKKVEEKLKLQKLLNPESEHDEIIILQDNDPGPGAYYNPHTFSSIKIQNKPSELQFFGSKSTRFQNSFSATTNESSHIGPGSYAKVNLRNSKGNENQGTSAPFWKKDQRFKNTGMNEFPGPLSYNPKNNVQSQSHFSLKTI